MKRRKEYEQERQNKDSIVCSQTGKNNGCILYAELQDTMRTSSDVSEF